MCVRMCVCVVLFVVHIGCHSQDEIKKKAEVMFVWKCVFEECRARVPGVSGPLQLRMQFIFFDTEGKKTQKERTEAQSKEGLSRRNMAARYMRYITGDCKTPSL